jgi:bacteriocin-like protein
MEKDMSTERELTNNELDAVSGGAGVVNIQCSGDELACALASLVVGAITSGGSGGGLVHEPIHAN